MKLSLIVAVVAILVVSTSGFVLADQVIWDNTGAASGYSIITQIDTGGAASSNTSECADDFVLAAPMTVTRIIPAYYFGTVNVDHWNIRIYGDNAGVPGTQLLSTTAPGGAFVPATTDQYPSLTLAQTFSAAANTTYWISLQAAYDQAQGSGLARWREINRANPSLLQGNVGYWRGTPVFGGLTQLWTWEPAGNKNGVGTTAEMLFTLYGTPVPEPSSAAALCGGLVALLGLARKRRS
jgi:hypothetical protein